MNNTLTEQELREILQFVYQKGTEMNDATVTEIIEEMKQKLLITYERHKTI
ncbi:hypothetical protein [Ornithinibacillus californiensis]|uniref:hypothetical protein n=1 Tax=Ornithinibacillus californiensis TaxID=161536 RepID=UPI0012EDDE87|nr:hypothetical protein [Ornithinibacillus californiensis]